MLRSKAVGELDYELELEHAKLVFTDSELEERGLLDRDSGSERGRAARVGSLFFEKKQKGCLVLGDGDVFFVKGGSGESEVRGGGRERKGEGGRATGY